MANTDGLIDFEVTGLRECAMNLVAFGKPAMVGKIIRKSLELGGRIPKAAGVKNARAIGLGFMGFKQRGNGRGQVRRYGRIPRSLKVNRAYIPKGDGGSTYRVNIVARGQRYPGLYMNKAPHAHLIEYGFKNKSAGRTIQGRPFLGPALSTTANQTIAAIAYAMQKQIDGLKFPVTGEGP